jgi:hypothetical protein
MSINKVYKAVISGNSIYISTIEDLINQGADPNITCDKGNTILDKTVSWKKESFLKIIQLCYSTKKLKEHAFSKALSRYLDLKQVDLQVIEALFNAGAHPDTLNSSGKSLLTLAAQWPVGSYIHLISLTTATHKEVDFSQALFHYLSEAKKIDFKILRALVNAGADPKIVDQSGRTLFQLAALANWSNSACVLLLDICSSSIKFTATDLSNELEKYIKIRGKLEPELSAAAVKVYQEKPATGEEIYQELSSKRIDKESMEFFAKKPKAKEKLIEYIDSCPNEVKSGILHQVFTHDTNLNHFFSVRRKLFSTSLSSGSFKILQEMRFPVSVLNENKGNLPPPYSL